MFTNINDFIPKTLVSFHENTDTLMMLHALEIAETGEGVDFFSQDTDWMELILKRMQIIGAQLSFTQSMSI